MTLGKSLQSAVLLHFFDVANIYIALSEGVFDTASGFFLILVSNVQVLSFLVTNCISTNKQYVKIKVMQNEINRCSMFFGKHEILVKL